MKQAEQEKWDRIYRDRGNTPPLPARVLEENLHLLPGSGSALDVACGRGANALLLARHGLRTQAWDISQEALDYLDGISALENLDLTTERRDIVSRPPEPESFDVIIVSRFLDRSIIDNLIMALNRDGLIYYQTFIRDRINETGPNNPDYLLDENELLALFKCLRLIVYREEGAIGDVRQGFRNEAMLIARNP